MGMPIIETACINRDDAITDIIQAVALEQASISHILKAEGEKLQKIINKENVTHDELIEVNNNNLLKIVLNKLFNIIAY